MSNEVNNPISNKERKESKLAARIKALGLIGFTFFLLKGIAWLFVLYFAGKGCA
jgi:hypothetical protein